MKTSKNCIPGMCSKKFSSIQKKQVMAVTGLLLCGFLIAHLLGNFLIIFSPEGFNAYAHQLTSTPLIYAAEAVLLILFLTHLFIAFKITWENKKARPEKYFMKTKTGDGTTFMSQTMPYTGLVILIFLISHLFHFKYGSYYSTEYAGSEIRDLYKTVIEYFASPINVAWYCFAMAAMAVHLGHGVQSTFQSLGFNHPKINCAAKFFGAGFAIIVPILFSLLAVWSYCLSQKSY